jgi:hypothetical protein
MAAPTNTFLTTAAIGNREDLSDTIYRIDPTETPFMSAIERAKATAVSHEWQTQALAAVDTANYQLEGDDAVAVAATPTVRLGNICNVSSKTISVSGTQEAVDHAGRDSEIAYQEMLKGMELKRDMETLLCGVNIAKTAGPPRKTASILSWIKNNTSFGAGGANPATADGAAIRTDGTQRAFTESQLKSVLNAAWTAGGKPDTIMAGAFNKQTFSTFTGRATPTEDTRAKKITASVDAYESDFGTLKVVPNRFTRTRDVLVLQIDMWAVAYITGRKMVSIPLAVTGDATRKEVLSEYALEARNEKSSGGVFDLTIS